MAIVIREIHVQAVVEKRVVHLTDISIHVINKIKEDVIQELQELQKDTGRKKNER